MNAVELQHIFLSYGEKNILKDVSWFVKKGEIATLLGPNGCGKSTLLRVLTGNAKGYEGTVLVKGKEHKAYDGKEMARSIAFLPQSPELPKDMIVEELVYCGRFPHQAWWKNTAQEDRMAVDEALKATKTDHLRHRVASSLSGGERQRVWIAMALAQEPDVLILDEPTTYLDINHQLEIMELLKKLNEEKGLTVIMVLHELNQAASYSHQLAILHNGRIAKAGTPTEVMQEELLEEVFSVKTKITQEEEGPFIRIKGLL